MRHLLNIETEMDRYTVHYYYKTYEMMKGSWFIYYLVQQGLLIYNPL